MLSLLSCIMPKEPLKDINTLPNEDCPICIDQNIQAYVKTEGTVFGHTTAEGAHHLICPPCNDSYTAANHGRAFCSICREDLSNIQMKYTKSSDPTKFIIEPVFPYRHSLTSNTLLKMYALAILTEEVDFFSLAPHSHHLI